MSKLLFRLRHVPEDEAADVRELLEQNGIEYFETFAGNWGISFPALWLKDDSRYEQARSLIDEYQQQRVSRVREEYKLSQSRGEVKTLWHSFVESPVRFLFYLTLSGLVLFLSLQVFLSF